MTANAEPSRDLLVGNLAEWLSIPVDRFEPGSRCEPRDPAARPRVPHDKRCGTELARQLDVRHLTKRLSIPIDRAGGGRGPESRNSEPPAVTPDRRGAHAEVARELGVGYQAERLRVPIDVALRRQRAPAAARRGRYKGRDAPLPASAAHERHQDPESSRQVGVP